jgi:hypothetical protein
MSDRGCYLLGEMIAKILHILETSLTRIRPQSLFQKRFEWQSEFLFVPEKRPLQPVSPVTRTCIVSGTGQSHLRSR